MTTEKTERVAMPTAAPPRNELQSREPGRADAKASAQPQAPVPFTPEQIATPAEGWPYIDSLMVRCTHGPWRGKSYILPNADAQAAIAAKWAVVHTEGLPDPNAPPPVELTAEEDAAATTAANEYVDAYNAQHASNEPQTEPPASPPEGGVTRGGDIRSGKDMHAGSRGTYETRSEVREKDERK